MAEILPLHFEPTTPLAPAVGVNIGQIMQARGLASEIALRNAQTEQATAQTDNIQAQAQGRQRDLADQNFIQQAMKDPATAAAFGGGDFTALKGNVQPKTLEGVQVAHDNHQKDLLANTKEQNSVAADNLGAIVDTLTGLKQMAVTDPASAAAAYPSALANLQEQKRFAYLPQAKPPAGITGDPKEIDQLLAGIGGLKGATDKALATQQEAAKPGLTKAQAIEATGKGNEAQANADLKNLQVKFMKDASPQQLDSLIDARIPPAEFPQQNSAAKAAAHLALSTTGDPKLANEAVEKVAGGIDEIRKTTSLIPAEVKKAVAVARAEAPIHTQTAVATARALNGTGAVGNVPPHLVPAATTAYNKSGEALAAAQTASDEIQKVIDMAGAGNKAAGANLPLMGVGAVNAVNGIKRINSAEIAQYGTAGSLIDKIQGKLQGWTEGKPIPDDVLADMKSLHTQLAESAQTKHAREVQSINQTYGSTFQPMKMQPAAAASPSSAPPAPAYKVGDTVLYQGKPHKVSAINNGKLVLEP